MTRGELQILGPIATRLHKQLPQSWSSLCYQTQYGPEFHEYPYYPAAFEFEGHACNAVANLGEAEKKALVERWRSRTRLIEITSSERIIQRYGYVLTELIIARARAAGARTSF